MRVGLFELSITAVLHPPAPSSLILPFLPLPPLSRVTCDTAWQTDVWQLHTVCANSGLSCKWSTFYPALSKHPTFNQVANMFHQQSTQITLWMNLKPKPSGVPYSRSSHEGSVSLSFRHYSRNCVNWWGLVTLWVCNHISGPQLQLCPNPQEQVGIRHQSQRMSGIVMGSLNYLWFYKVKCAVLLVV